MALTGLQIQKLLPKTNCKECGSNTCLAFAMKLAAKKANLSECPYASEEAKQVLGAASEPPVKGIALGKGKDIKIGEETVLYRHEKTFVHQTLLAVNIDDTLSESEATKTFAAINGYVLERVGEKLGVEMVCVTNSAMDSDAFAALVTKAHAATSRPLVIRSGNAVALAAAAKAVSGSGCVLASATEETADSLGAVAKEHGHALAITASTLDGIATLSARIKESGFNNLVLDLGTRSPAEQLSLNTVARRAALKDALKPLGYAFLTFVNDHDLFAGTAAATVEIAKYGGICVLPSFDPAQLAPLMTARLNIYTDPQKPIQVEPKVYAVGDPTPTSPVFVTTNFSLTYFIVSGEIENSGASAWLVVPECEGMSVLTAWAAGKFSGASIAKFVKADGLEDRVSTRQIIIPGYVGQISGELEESLPGWKVVVGPQEAGDIESFVKSRVLAA